MAGSEPPEGSGPEGTGPNASSAEAKAEADKKGDPSASTVEEPSPARPTAPFPVVGIGASAGGLEALEALTRRLTSDGMAFIVLQHLAPHQESVLTEILARGTSLKVVTIRDGVRLERNTIYVTPPNAEISVEQGILRLSPASDRVPRHSIDAFLRSLADDVGSMGIGVILSGAGTDGTLGLRALKEEGGITFVQDPATAAQPSMPQSAIDAGCADACLTPVEIGDELMRLSAHPFVAKQRPSHHISSATLGQLFDRLRRAFGVDFAHYKLGTIERRIERRMALQRLEKPEDYLRLVASSGDELARLYSDLLIGVTGFFRDREPFEALKTVVFPRLLEQRNLEAPIRIWVPGCATGEEAYSLAIALLEHLDVAPAAGVKVQIFATDIDDGALARARLGQYPKNIELDVSPERLQRFFSRQDKGYQISRQIRDMVVFAHHNLGKDPPFSRLDLISCRNVLIYMQGALQRRVLRVFHYALNPDGFLLLGASESVGDASDLFSLLDRKLKLYVKKNIPSAAVFDFAFGMRMEPPEPVAFTAHAVERRPPVSMQQLADRKVLEKFAPSGLLVDDRLDVIQFRGQTGPYLQPSPGAATLNVLKLVRPELLLELRSTLKQVADEGLPRTSAPVSLWGDQMKSTITLDVLPIQEPGAKRQCFLVLFHELVSPERPAAPARAEDQGAEPHAHALERELLITKEYLQTTVQELETANEELQSSNEELQSSNEELQSTNEELETSKEELQSTNEELATVNEELHNRMAQLGVSNDDLLNLIEGLTVPFVIVGMDLRIRRFSAQAEKLLSLIPGDVGRPIAYLSMTLDAPQLHAVVSDVINMVHERVQRVRCSDGRWYAARVLPYRTSDHAIRGALIELLRAPPPRKPGELAEVHELAGKVLSMLPHVLMLLDEQLRIVWVNKQFFDRFVVGAEVLGRALDEVWAGRTTHPELWNALEEAVAGGPGLNELWVERPFGRAGGPPMKFSTRSLPEEGDRMAMTLVVMEEGSLP